MEGIIIQGIGSFYSIYCDGVTYVCRAQKKLRKVSIPKVGDRVIFTPGADEETDGWIESICTRQNALIRPPVANIDILLIVVAPMPEADLLLCDRLILFARQQNIVPMVLVNKADISDALFRQLAEQYRGTEIPVLSVSAETGNGLEDLKNRITNKTVCFAGQSAVGKSSLLNALLGLSHETGEMSRKTGRGRHTTRQSELLIQDNLRILDTPGFSLLTLDAKPEDVPSLYPEYTHYAENCYFTECRHLKEPKCAVKAAIAEGMLSKRRHARYEVLMQEAQEYWKGRYH